MNNLLKGAALFVGGALAGAVAALLLTPKNGEEVRHEIAELANEAKKRVEDLSNQVKNEVEKRIGKAKAEKEA